MRFLFHNKESTKICLAHYMRVPNRFFRIWDQAYLKAGIGELRERREQDVVLLIIMIIIIIIIIIQKLL